MARFAAFGRERDAPRLSDAQREIEMLRDELTLTVAFSAKMIRDGHLEAAAGVVEEQRRSLADATSRLEAGVSGSRRRLPGPALAGIAAAAVLGTGVLMGIGRHEESRAPVVHLDRARTQLASAQSGPRDSASVRAALDVVRRTVLRLPTDAAADPQVKRTLDDIRRRVLDLAPVRVEDVARDVAGLVSVIDRAARESVRHDTSTAPVAATPSGSPKA